MLAIVWLPVATAMVGLTPTDRPQAVRSIGAMELASIGLDVVVARRTRVSPPQEPEGTPGVRHASV